MAKTIRIFKLSSLLFISILGSVFAINGGYEDDRLDADWWKTTSIYQIYPRSFQDSDGDGIGDLKGIETRLEYFVELGIETIWLSPIFKSPMKDFGYDISDFRDIDPIFGTLDDFKDLLSSAHEKGLKIVLDFVPNHSSDQHEWFQRSLAREDPYTDYYVWEDKIGTDESGQPIPPNNWLSFFRYSAWEWNDQRQQFYLHQFVKEQPDLNYRNPLVQKEMEDVLTFWLELGVDGFRQDAVAYIWEDEQLRDEPPSGNPNAIDENDYDSLLHIYSNNLPETREIVLAGFDRAIKDFSATDGFARVNFLEVYFDIEEQLPYYNCSDFPFNFYLITKVTNPVTAESLKTAITYLTDSLSGDMVANWVLGNHDNWRVAYRLQPELIDVMNMVSLSLPGVSVTYYGEEIGMDNNMDISFEDTVDPSGTNCGPDHYNDEVCSRDPERTPMQWNDGYNAGFNDNGPTWLPVNDDYKTVNVETQELQSDSHISFFKALMRQRAFDVLRQGTLQIHVDGNVLAIGRRLDQAVQVSVMNVGDTSVTASLDGVFDPNFHSGVVLINNLGENSLNNPPSLIVDVENLSLEPYECIMISLL